MARLKEIYWKEIAPKLKEELKLSNVMEVPRVTKRQLAHQSGVRSGLPDGRIQGLCGAD
jgi:ribosomal protein L5